MSFDAVVELRDDLDAMLHQIRSERHIRPPVFRCTHCGHFGEGAKPHVSVRAMILSLGRFGITPTDQIRALEKALVGGVAAVAAPFGAPRIIVANYGAEPCKTTPSSHVFPA